MGRALHPDLFPYQREGGQFLAAREVAFLFDPMGVGKTPQAIAGADEANCQTVTVLCPPIAKENWRREFLRWQTRERTAAVVATGADLRRSEILGADVLIVGYSLLVSPLARRVLTARRVDVLICDEAHMLKNKDAQRTKAVYGARLDRRGVAGAAARVWLLTGTPMPNNHSELYTHLAALCRPTLQAAL